MGVVVKVRCGTGRNCDRCPRRRGGVRRSWTRRRTSYIPTRSSTRRRSSRESSGRRWRWWRLNDTINSCARGTDASRASGARPVEAGENRRWCICDLRRRRASIRRRRPVAFVGKGITFDTGGLSLKSKDGMCGMKTDMGGAAGMLCAFESIAREDAECAFATPLDPSCASPRTPSAPARFVPTTFSSARAEETVEINNTDAEGRLVLADGVAYVTDPGSGVEARRDYVVDMAALTGRADDRHRTQTRRSRHRRRGHGETRRHPR